MAEAEAVERHKEERMALVAMAAKGGTQPLAALPPLEIHWQARVVKEEMKLGIPV